MAKRYGRTQKRKHREHIEELKKTVESERSLKNYATKQKNEIASMYDELVEHIRHYVQNSSLIKPKEIAYRLRRLPPLFKDYVSPNIPLSIEYLGPMQTVEIQHINLELVRVLSEYDDFQRARHIKICSSIGNIGYYISDQAIHYGHLGHLKHIIMEELIEMFKKGFKK